MVDEFVILGAQGRNPDVDNCLVLWDANELEYKIKANSTSGDLEIIRNGSLVFSTAAGEVIVNDTLSFSTATTGVNEIIVPDNLADALSIKISGGNDLIKLVSTDNGEGVTITPAVTLGGRLDFTGFNPVAANTDGGLIKAGVSATPIVEDTADYKFLSFYFDNGATTGDSRGIYLRQYITGAGGGGDAARFYSTVSDVAAATVRGAHISLDFGASGTVTGLGAALGATIHIPDDATQTGTLTAVNAEIWSEGATSDPAGAKLSVFRVANSGNGTGKLDVDTDAYLFDFDGWTAGSGSMIGALAGNEPTWTAKTALIKCLAGSTVIYLVAVEL